MITMPALHAEEERVAVRGSVLQPSCAMHDNTNHNNYAHATTGQHDIELEPVKVLGVIVLWVAHQRMIEP
jgi:hypothetical protein